jgi:hypothetical protein
MKQQRATFEQLMEQLARRHGVQAVFSDFLTLLVCAFSLGQREEEYLATIRRYEKPEAYRFSEALAALTVEMTGDGSGMVDVLGDYFERFLSFGRNGQFFTPQNICDMMARLQNPVHALQRILDPACGSGRMLMAMAKLNRHALFYGADNDRNCALMTVVNLTLNSMYGEVSWMNSITNQYYAGWLIEPTIHGVPRVRQITEAESYIKLRVPEKPAVTPKIEIPVSKIENIQPKQGLLFEF